MISAFVVKGLSQIYSESNNSLTLIFQIIIVDINQIKAWQKLKCSNGV